MGFPIVDVLENNRGRFSSFMVVHTDNWMFYAFATSMGHSC